MGNVLGSYDRNWRLTHTFAVEGYENYFLNFVTEKYFIGSDPSHRQFIVCDAQKSVIANNKVVTSLADIKVFPSNTPEYTILRTLVSIKYTWGIDEGDEFIGSCEGKVYIKHLRCGLYEYQIDGIRCLRKHIVCTCALPYSIQLRMRRLG